MMAKLSEPEVKRGFLHPCSSRKQLLECLFYHLRTLNVGAVWTRVIGCLVGTDGGVGPQALASSRYSQLRSKQRW